MCERVDEIDRLEGEAFKLREQGRIKEAVEKYLQEFKLLRDRNPVDAAMVLLRVAGLKARISLLDEAVEDYELAADVALSCRGFGFAVIALKEAESLCLAKGRREKAAELRKKIEIATQQIPHNFEECFAELERQLTPEQLTAFKNMKENEIIAYHHELGLWIRNSWGLWHNSNIAEYLQNIGIRHPDDMSHKILLEFHRHLNGKTKTRQSEVT